MSTWPYINMKYKPAYESDAATGQEDSKESVESEYRTAR